MFTSIFLPVRLITVDSIIHWTYTIVYNTISMPERGRTDCRLECTLAPLCEYDWTICAWGWRIVCAKTAESIMKMPSGGWRNRLLVGVHTSATWQIKLNRLSTCYTYYVCTAAFFGFVVFLPRVRVANSWPMSTTVLPRTSFDLELPGCQCGLLSGVGFYRPKQQIVCPRNTEK